MKENKTFWCSSGNKQTRICQNVTNFLFSNYLTATKLSPLDNNPWSLFSKLPAFRSWNLVNNWKLDSLIWNWFNSCKLKFCLCKSGHMKSAIPKCRMFGCSSASEDRSPLANLFNLVYFTELDDFSQLWRQRPQHSNLNMQKWEFTKGEEKVWINLLIMKFEIFWHPQHSCISPT